jgi:hypothetical protein
VCGQSQHPRHLDQDRPHPWSLPLLRHRQSLEGFTWVVFQKSVAAHLPLIPTRCSHKASSCALSVQQMRIIDTLASNMARNAILAIASVLRVYRCRNPNATCPAVAISNRFAEAPARSVSSTILCTLHASRRRSLCLRVASVSITKAATPTRVVLGRLELTVSARARTASTSACNCATARATHGPVLSTARSAIAAILALGPRL